MEEGHNDEGSVGADSVGELGVLAQLPRRAPPPVSPPSLPVDRRYDDADSISDMGSMTSHDEDLSQHLNRSLSFSHAERSQDTSLNLPAAASSQPASAERSHRSRDNFKANSGSIDKKKLSPAEVESMVDAAERAAFASKLGMGFSPQPPPGGAHQRNAKHTSPRSGSHMETAATEQRAHGHVKSKLALRSRPAAVNSSGTDGSSSTLTATDDTHSVRDHRGNLMGLPKVPMSHKNGGISVDQQQPNDFHNNAQRSNSKKPLYLRLMQAAEREARIKAEIREEEYRQWKEARKGMNPSKEDIRRHMENHDRLFKQRGDAVAAAASAAALAADSAVNAYKEYRSQNKNNKNRNKRAVPRLPSIAAASNVADANDADSYYDSGAGDNDSVSAHSNNNHNQNHNHNRKRVPRKVVLESDIQRQKQREAEEEMKLRMQKRKAFGRKVRDRAIVSVKDELSPERRAEIESDFEDFYAPPMPSLEINGRSPRFGASPRGDFKSPKKRVSFGGGDYGDNNDSEYDGIARPPREDHELAGYSEFKGQSPVKQGVRFGGYSSASEDESGIMMPAARKGGAKENRKAHKVYPKEKASPVMINHGQGDKGDHGSDRMDIALLPHGPDWMAGVLRYDPEEDKLSEIYEQGFTIMMIENGLIEDS